MHKLLTIAIIGILLLAACTNTYKADQYKEIEIAFNKNYEEGNKKGYEEGKNKQPEYINKLYPLQNSYSQYDLGYINGYFVGCQEVKSDCAKVEELVKQILNDKTEKYKVQTNNKTTTYP